MKKIQKLAAILAYLLLMAALFDFHLPALLNVRQLAVVVLGMVLLYLPGGWRQRIDTQMLAQSALTAGCIETAVLLYTRFYSLSADTNITQTAAAACRPLLYGFLLWCIFIQPENKKTTPADAPLTPSAAGSCEHAQPCSEGAPAVSGIPSASACYGRFRDLGLTAREAEVALQVCRGLSNCEIALALGISETTVKKHLSNIFQKLALNKRDELRRLVAQTHNS